jgi:hypothetical protein
VSKQVICREIDEGDVAGIIELLASGFPKRPRITWHRVFQRLSDHSTPVLYPRYGFLLEHEGMIVGVVLTIFSTIMADGRETIRGNVSSWYVIPNYRVYAAMLSTRALRRREVTYMNITPDPATIPILEAQGYRKYCDGFVISAPALKISKRAKIEMFNHPVDELSVYENQLLLDHARYGCISVVCYADGRGYPFVFATSRICRAPAAYLTYCRSIEEFVCFAGSLGRFLAWRGHPLVIIDANHPIQGLMGRFYGEWPKYFKGTEKPRLGDLAYTERPIFGM